MTAKTLEKRTYDSRIFDINCIDLLDPTETITNIVSVADDGSVLTFGPGAINTSQTSYPDGSIGPIGQVVQVLISGGSIPSTSTSLLCTCRAKVQTSFGNHLDVTFLVLLKDHITS